VVPVTTGDTDGTNTVILSGLKEGDTVVLAGFEKLGLPQFASTGKLPGFLTRGPLGTGGGR
jgi:multidrug efflux pump subunit AcrA (membrane-fusion protein)